MRARAILIGLVVLVAAACSKGKLTPDAATTPGQDGGVQLADGAVDASDAAVVVDGSPGDLGDAPSATDLAPPRDGPSSVCPRDPPSNTASCADHAIGLVCNYAEPPPSTCSTRCECRGQRWVCDRPCSTGFCPSNLPTTFTACSPPNLRCMYPTACGTFTFTCDAFEIGAPPVWYCSGACTCDAGADPPGDAGAE